MPWWVIRGQMLHKDQGTRILQQRTHSHGGPDVLSEAMIRGLTIRATFCAVTSAFMAAVIAFTVGKSSDAGVTRVVAMLNARSEIWP